MFEWKIDWFFIFATRMFSVLSQQNNAGETIISTGEE